MQALAKKEIPVHTFYVKGSCGGDARPSFEQIARATGGHCEPLDIDSLAGAERLTQLVTERILDNLGGAALVELYREKYVKGYVFLLTKSPSLLFGQQANEAKSQSSSVQPTQSDNRTVASNRISPRLTV